MRRPEAGIPGALGLESSHLRRIGAVLVLLDERLDEVERWASWPLPSGPLYRWRLDMDPASRLRLRAKVAKTREELRSIAWLLGIESQVRVASTAIQTLMTFSLIDLEELEPKRMKAYGALSEKQAEALGALWPSLREPLEAIRRQCTPARAEGEAP